MSDLYKLVVHLDLPDLEPESALDVIETAILALKFVHSVQNEDAVKAGIPKDRTVCAHCGAKHPLTLPYAWGYLPPDVDEDSNERWCDRCFKFYKRTGELP